MALQTVPRPTQRKASFFREPPRGQKATAWSQSGGQKARVAFGAILAVGRACHRPERGTEQRASGSLDICRPEPGCPSDTTHDACAGEELLGKERM